VVWASELFFLSTWKMCIVCQSMGGTVGGVMGSSSAGRMPGMCS
jgi:hypothetical protein